MIIVLLQKSVELTYFDTEALVYPKDEICKSTPYQCIA